MDKPHIYIPTDMNLLVADGECWKPVHSLSNSVKCWTEEGYVDVTITKCHPHSKINCYAILDAVTTVAVDINHIHSLIINYRWMPPWVMRQDQAEPSLKCTLSDHEVKALTDFSEQRPCLLDTNFIECKVPIQRYEKIKTKKSVSSLNAHREGRYQIVRVPKHLWCCESSLSSRCRNHALAYINMVVHIRGIIVKKTHRTGAHVEIRDKGPKLRSSSFRRLRRMLTLCAVRNGYIPRVSRLKDGNPHIKRRLRMQLDSDHVARYIEVKEKLVHSTEFHCISKTIPTNNKRAKLVPIESDQTPITWYKVTLSRGSSLAISGVMITMNTKKTDNTKY